MLQKEIKQTEEGKKVRAFRTYLGLSGTSFALPLKTPQSTISRYESGDYMVPTEFIKKMHDVYKMRYEWFFNNEGPKVESSDEPKKGNLIKDISILSEQNQLLSHEVSKLKIEFRKIHALVHKMNMTQKAG